MYIITTNTFRINEHLEEKEGVTFKLLDVYNAYLEASETAGGAGVEQILFYKVSSLKNCITCVIHILFSQNFLGKFSNLSYGHRS